LLFLVTHQLQRLRFLREHPDCPAVSRGPTVSHQPANPLPSPPSRAASSLSSSHIFSPNGEAALLQGTKTEELTVASPAAVGEQLPATRPGLGLGEEAKRTQEPAKLAREGEQKLALPWGPIAPHRPMAGCPSSHGRAPMEARIKLGMGWEGKQRHPERSGGCGGSHATPPAACVGTPRHPPSPGGPGGDCSEPTQVSGCRRRV